MTQSRSISPEAKRSSRSRAICLRAVGARVLRGVAEGVCHGQLLLREPAAAVLADNEELRIGVLLVYPLRFLEDIVVIRTGKSLIRRDDKAAQGALAVFGVVAVSREVPAVDSLIDGEDARYLMVEHVKVRANPRQARLWPCASLPRR